MSFFGFARELTNRRLKIDEHDEQKHFDQQVSSGLQRNYKRKRLRKNTFLNPYL